MTSATLRKKLHGYIDIMPDRNLTALKPLLSVLAEPFYSIEEATPEENAKGQKIMAEYKKDPSSFVPWEKR